RRVSGGAVMVQTGRTWRRLRHQVFWTGRLLAILSAFLAHTEAWPASGGAKAFKSPKAAAAALLAAAAQEGTADLIASLGRDGKDVGFSGVETADRGRAGPASRRRRKRLCSSPGPRRRSLSRSAQTSGPSQSQSRRDRKDGSSIRPPGGRSSSAGEPGATS